MMSKICHALTEMVSCNNHCAYRYDVDKEQLVIGSEEGVNTADARERTVILKPARKDQPLGLNLRGGSEFDLGIYVSR